MELSKVSFEVNKKSYLRKEEKDFLIDLYHKFFVKIYGCDMLDILASVTKTNSTEWLKKRNNLQQYSENQVRALNVIESVDNDESYNLLVIRDVDDRLIGGALLRKLNDVEASISDVVIECVSVDEQREIWRRAIIFAEDYFVSLGYGKMYIEIPLQDGPLLGRASELGFVEDPKDISVTIDTRTYLVNKKLERVQNEKFDITCE